MAISSITSAINNRMRLSGMVSGLDTDSIVTQLMATEQAKVDRVIQKRDIDVWKTEAYRDITSTLQSFYDEYFDTLSSKNLKSANSFSSYAATFADTTATNYINITPGASAKAGTYSISEIKAATSASISTGANVTIAAETGTISDADVQNIKSSSFNNNFVFSLNGKTVTLKLKDGLTNVGELRQELEDKINAAFGSGNINVINNGGKISFSTVRPTDVFSIGTANNEGAGKLFSAAPTEASPFILNEGNNKFELTIGGVTKTVTVPLVDINGDPKTEFTSAAELAAAIQRGVDDPAAFGSSSGITFEDKNGKVAYTTTPSQTVSIGYTKNEATNTILKIDPAKMSNKVNLSGKIADIKDGFNIVPDTTGTTGDIKFSINGKEFTFDSQTTSINDIMIKVNADTTVKVNMTYDTTTNSFKIQSKGLGATDKLDIVDISGSIMKTLGLDAPATTAVDASVKIKSEDGTELLIVRPTNLFTYDGLSFDIKKDSPVGADPIKVTVTSDTSKTYEYIKTFVDKYNEVIGKLNTEISEKKDRSYMPLTDAQKEAMSEEQIKQWEEKAKTGLLRNDSSISSTLSKLRSVLYDSVEGVGISLYSIGITTSPDYKQKGKLVIDEKKLKDALASQPDEVAKLFTSSSNKTYYQSLNSSTVRSERYKESGIAQRFSDALQDAIRTTTDANGYKGSLVIKAGVVGDGSEYTNLLYKEIVEYEKSVSEMNKKLVDKQNALYAKFTAMETALNRMNSQSSWLSSQFNSGQM